MPCTCAATDPLHAQVRVLSCWLLLLMLILQTALGADASSPAARSNLTSAGVQCVRQIDACRCETSTGGRIDLSALAKTGDFAFSNQQGPTGNFVYFYNPCSGVACDGSTDAAACQRSQDAVPTREFLLGTQASAKFETDPSTGLYLKYTGLSGDQQQREAQLQLVCDTSGSGENVFTPLDDGNMGVPIVYKMSLLSSHCCEVKPEPGGGGGGGLSGGDILLIVFFSLAVVYVAAGLAVNLFVRKRSGRDAVPNAEFWSALPGLVRDGGAFTYATAKGLVAGKRGDYSSV